MSLSYEKLNNILGDNGILIRKTYVNDNYIIYLDVLNIKNSDNFLIYIPSDYNIKSKHKENYEINNIKIDNTGTIALDYGENPDNRQVEDTYDTIELNDNIDNQSDMEKHLEENYNKSLDLNNAKENDKVLKQIFRQLNRLKYGVKDISYKLCVQYSKYLYCINRHNELVLYEIKNLNIDNNRKFLIAIDLEKLYEKMDTFSLDIKSVRKGVFSILDKNHVKNNENFSKILENKNIFLGNSNDIIFKKNKYNEFRDNLEILLEQLCLEEKNHILKIMDIREKYKNEKIMGTLNSDIEKSHLIGNHEKQITQINMTKQEIIKCILEIDSKLENLYLKVDEIFFDNIIMIDSILKNCNTLEKL